MAGMIENRPNRRRAGGFTLVELMVVIALIGVIASLVISVGSGVRIKAAEDETRARLRILAGAAEAYNDTMGRYPDDIIDWRDDDDKAALDADGPTLSAQRNTTYLMGKLNQVDACRKMLDQLASETRDSATFETIPSGVNDPYDRSSTYNNASTSRDFFIDSFDQPLNYQRRGGAGGTPVVISAGSDGVFGTGDDLRSDDQ